MAGSLDFPKKQGLRQGLLVCGLLAEEISKNQSRVNRNNGAEKEGKKATQWYVTKLVPNGGNYDLILPETL